MSKYVPYAPTRACPHGCGTYALNKDGRHRRHPIGGGGCATAGCERGCVGDVESVAILSAEPAKPLDVALTAPRELSVPCIAGLIYGLAPSDVRDVVQLPGPRSLHLLRRYGLIKGVATFIRTTEAGREALAKLERVPGDVPEPLRRWYRNRGE